MKFLLFFFALCLTVLPQATPPAYPYPKPLPTSGSTPPTTIKLTGVLNPSGYGDRPAMWDNFLGGGYRVVSSTTERDDIASTVRKEGMWVKVTTNAHVYELTSDLSTWYDLGPVTAGSFGSSINIYNTSSSLTGNRALGGAGFNLTLGSPTLLNNFDTLATTQITLSAPTLNLAGGSFTKINPAGPDPIIFAAAPATPSLTDEILARDPATGQVTFGPAYQIGMTNNLYNRDGNFTSDRFPSGNGHSIDWLDFTQFWVHTSANGVARFGNMTPGSAFNSAHALINANKVYLNAATNLYINGFDTVSGALGTNHSTVLFSTNRTAPGSDAQVMFRDPTTLDVRWSSSYTAANVGTVNATNFTGVLPIANGGTASTTARAAIDALSTKGADVPSATTTDLSATTGDFVDVTGTTTITGLGTAPAGVERTVRFTGILTINQNATSLILPGANNITTYPNDRMVFRSLGSGNWICIDYTPTQITGSGATVFSVNPVFTSGITVGFEQITGVAGGGYIEYPSQSSAPSAPVGGFRQYADSSGRFSWIRASDGFIRSFDATLTADRVYTLPNASMTFARIDSAQTFTGIQTFDTSIVSPLIVGGTSTTSDLFLQTTSGVGAAGADMHFLVGNNGSMESITILNSGLVGINRVAPTAQLHINGPLQPASVGTTPGSANANTLVATAGTGGDTSIATTGTGGNGSAISLTSGSGGQATAAATAATGGNSGVVNLVTGSGGPSSVAGTGSNAGGIAGAINISSGTGGSATGVTSGNNTGGVGGNVVITAGTGGAANSGSGNNIGGSGGALSLSSGTGGIGVSSGGNGGSTTINGGTAAAMAGASGGSVSLLAKAGSSTGTGGDGGSSTITSGNAGGDNTVNRGGGAVTITSGTSKGSSSGGAISLIGGAGGLGTGATGASGSSISITAGAGGANATTSGVGGVVTISGGLGGSTGTPGAGGSIILKTAATTSLTTAVTINNDQSTTFAGNITVLNLNGATTSTTRAAGKVGERMSSVISSGSAVTCVTATTTNVTSITLTPGNWLVHGKVNFSQSGVTGTDYKYGQSTTTATLGADPTYGEIPLITTTITGTLKENIPLQSYSVATATTTQVFLVAQATFVAGTVTAFGEIYAVRTD